jgi:CMP-N,N'-diacetyllegionaminic acid synthase
MTVLGLIPARGGSKGIPRKNLVQLDGQPLIAYSIEAARNSSLITDVMISTDDAEIAAAGEALGVKVPRLRSPQYATDSAGVVEVVEEALDWLRRDGKPEPELVVLLQPTSPLRSAQDIDGTIAALRANGCESAISVHEMIEHPAECVTVTADGWRYLVPPPAGSTRRQDYAGSYQFINGAVYAVTPRFLRKNRCFVMDSAMTALYEMDRARGVDINYPFDLKVAEAFIRAAKIDRKLV